MLSLENHPHRNFSMDVATYEQPREKSKRPQLSCNSCRARKVKCDRLQPCSACSLHQISDRCQYDLSDSERKPILQAEALRAKDREISWLKEQIHSLGGSPASSEHVYDRKKRKVASYAASTQGIHTAPQHHSQAVINRTRCHAQYAPLSQAASSGRVSKRSKPPVKSISVPLPDNDGLTIARPSSSKQQHWQTAEMGHQQQWSIELKRNYSTQATQAQPGFPLYDASKFSPSEIHRHDSTVCMPAVSRADDEAVALSQAPKLWPSCFSDGTESLPMMSTCGSMANTAAFMSLGSMAPTTSSMVPTHSPTLSNGYCYRSSSISTPSPASCPASTYAQSASNSSLHTPSASHPVSPASVSNPPYCVSQPQSQPPSPMWDFDARAAQVQAHSHAQHHMYLHGGATDPSSALAAQLAAAGAASVATKDNAMSAWSWKHAWATPLS